MRLAGLRGRHQNRVASRVAMFIIDGFEMIQIERDASQLVLMPLCQRNRMSPLLLERPARQNASQTVYGGELSQFQLIHRDPRKIGENLGLRMRKFSWLETDSADRSNIVTLAGAQRDASIETNVRFASNVRIFSEPKIDSCIGHDDRDMPCDCISTKRFASCDFAAVHPIVGFVPLPMPIKH